MEDKKDVVVDAPISKAELNDVVAEVTAKFTEALNEHKKSFYLTEKQEDAAAIAHTEKYGRTVKFLNALKRGDTMELREIEKAEIADRQKAGKALSEGTTTAGGYLVPEEFETKVYAFASENNVIYADSTKVRMTSNIMNVADLTTDVQAAWTDELAVKSVSEPAFGRKQIILNKLAATAVLSDEVYEDAFVNLIDMLAERFGRSIRKEREYAFLNGNGADIDGILNTLGVTNYEGVAAFSDITYDTLVALQERYFNVANGIDPDAAFYCSMAAWNTLRTKKSSNDGHYLVMPQNGNMMSPSFLGGIPIKVVTGLPTTTAASTKFAFFANLRNHHLIGEKGGLKVSVVNTGTIGATNLYTQDATGFRIVDRVGAVVVNPSGIVTLSTTA